jgi:hypothetical protein
MLGAIQCGILQQLVHMLERDQLQQRYAGAQPVAVCDDHSDQRVRNLVGLVGGVRRVLDGSLHCRCRLDCGHCVADCDTSVGQCEQAAARNRGLLTGGAHHFWRHCGRAVVCGLRANGDHKRLFRHTRRPVLRAERGDCVLLLAPGRARIHFVRANSKFGLGRQGLFPVDGTE